MQPPTLGPLGSGPAPPGPAQPGPAPPDQPLLDLAIRFPAAINALPRSPRRLSPLSPIVRIGRSILGLAIVLTAANTTSQSSSGGGHDFVIDYLVIGLTVIGGVVSWFVTTWTLEGDILQVHTGLIRRKTIRVPLSRVQAVDLVEPLLARMLGLAEVRVRTAGGTGGDARLMYLKIDEAYQARAALLALVHGLPDSTPPPPEVPLMRVSNAQLLGSILLTGTSVGVLLGIATFIGLLLAGSVGQAILASSGGAVLYLFALGRGAVKRVVAEWDFEVAEAPDGLRIRCGLASRVAETIPYGRVQAVRMLEPLFWRPLGWQRLEIHLAGSGGRKGGEPRGALRRALLPVGSRAEAEALIARVLPDHLVSLSRPPRRAAWRAPFSYHFLAAGRNPVCSVSVSGRVRRLTEWAPLAKVQSVRSEQGPIQRALDLGSVRLDIAGRRTSVLWLHRSSDEMVALMEELPAECRVARDRDASVVGTVGARTGRF